MRSPTKSPKRKRSSAATAPDAPVVGAAAVPTVALASNCSIKDAAALKDSLCAVVNADESVVLDASSIERVDTATIQLLCAFVRERQARDQKVVWQDASAAMLEAARLLGVQTLLALR